MKDNIFNNFGMGLIHFSTSKPNSDLINTGDLVDYGDDEIRKVFFCELRKFGQTTSLDVKNKLRQLNFFAEQKQVSADLLDIGKEVDSIEAFYNGTYLTYYIDENQMQNPGIIDIKVTKTPEFKNSILDDVLENIPTNEDHSLNLTTEKSLEYTRRNGDVMVATKIKMGHPGEWECKCNPNSYVQSCDVLYFDQKWTRDQVRAAYASLNLIKSNDVRARKVN